MTKISLFFFKSGCTQGKAVLIYMGTDKWTLSSAGRATDS